MSNIASKKQTNADRIRAMSDEELATQFTQVVKAAFKAITGIDFIDEVLNQIRLQTLDKLKQPVEEE